MAFDAVGIYSTDSIIASKSFFLVIAHRTPAQTTFTGLPTTSDVTRQVSNLSLACLFFFLLFQGPCMEPRCADEAYKSSTISPCPALPCLSHLRLPVFPPLSPRAVRPFQGGGDPVLLKIVKGR